MAGGAGAACGDRRCAATASDVGDVAAGSDAADLSAAGVAGDAGVAGAGRARNYVAVDENASHGCYALSNTTYQRSVTMTTMTRTTEPRCWAGGSRRRLSGAVSLFARQHVGPRGLDNPTAHRRCSRLAPAPSSAPRISTPPRTRYGPFREIRDLWLGRVLGLTSGSSSIAERAGWAAAHDRDDVVGRCCVWIGPRFSGRAPYARQIGRAEPGMGAESPVVKDRHMSACILVESVGYAIGGHRVTKAGGDVGVRRRTACSSTRRSGTVRSCATRRSVRLVNS